MKKNTIPYFQYHKFYININLKIINLNFLYFPINFDNHLTSAKIIENFSFFKEIIHLNRTTVRAINTLSVNRKQTTKHQITSHIRVQDTNILDIWFDGQDKFEQTRNQHHLNYNSNRHHQSRKFLLLFTPNFINEFYQENIQSIQLGCPQSVLDSKGRNYEAPFYSRHLSPLGEGVADYDVPWREVEKPSYRKSGNRSWKQRYAKKGKRIPRKQMEGNFVKCISLKGETI